MTDTNKFNGIHNYTPETQKALLRALAVMVFDKKISAFLAVNDPQALKQAEAAIAMVRAERPDMQEAK